MAPNLAGNTAIGAKRAAASWITGGSRVRCRALHSLDPLDFSESSVVSSQQKSKKPSPFPEDPSPSQRVRAHRRREVPRLRGVDSTRVTYYKFKKLWTQRVERRHPFKVMNMPGFLESQSWFQHPESNPDGEFTSRAPSKLTDRAPYHDKPGSKPSFAMLRDSIIASAIRPVGGASRHSAMGQLFDSLGVRFKIKRINLVNDITKNVIPNVPLEKFRRWLVKTGRSTSHNLDSTVDRLLKSAEDSQLIWEPFEAPLAFIREVLQYNQELGADDHPDVIARLEGLIELEDRLTEDFPYPLRVREVAGVTYEASSCSIRFGIRPLRGDIRRSTDITVLGQLAGHSRVLLVPPKLDSLRGLGLESHPHVRRMKGADVARLSSRPVKCLEKSMWNEQFEKTIPERLDVTLGPGEVVLIPDGWWHGTRSINYHNQLHATVGWHLHTDESPYKSWQEREDLHEQQDQKERQEQQERSSFRRIVSKLEVRRVTTET
ncbi:hypothetical protein PG994_008112 [Apiospora phragmitis]|uniref:JmjC domain-containing protein n=1 Tax=Apiospora phragmitis TaxID=2905665 RepID=A0ABR1UUI0_9PEZI